MPHIQSAVQCFTLMIKNEGPKSLFSGIIPPVLTSTAANAIIFSSYNRAIREISIAKGGLNSTTSDTFIAGMFAGMCQTMITCPTDVIKVRLQCGNSQYSGVIDCISKTVTEKGPRGLFHGYTPTFVRDVPSFGVYFTSYYVLRDALKDYCGDITSQFIAGACAGAMSWCTAYPVDVAKTIIQMNPKEGRSFVEVIRETAKTKGVSYLFRGFGPTILRSIPVNAVVFPVYEIMIKVLST
jgi:solute carrier family 25 carnitine/acylcarnitine transporter 20/29